MGAIREYQKLTYIECYDGEMRTTPVAMEVISKLLNEVQFLPIGNELINKSNIKRVFTKEVTDVDDLIYSIKDKDIRNKIVSEINKRTKDWLRVNVEIVQNLLSKYQEDVDR